MLRFKCLGKLPEAGPRLPEKPLPSPLTKVDRSRRIMGTNPSNLGLSPSRYHTQVPPSSSYIACRSQVDCMGLLIDTTSCRRYTTTMSPICLAECSVPASSLPVKRCGSSTDDKLWMAKVDDRSAPVKKLDQTAGSLQADGLRKTTCIPSHFNACLTGAHPSTDHAAKKPTPLAAESPEWQSVPVRLDIGRQQTSWIPLSCAVRRRWDR